MKAKLIFVFTLLTLGLVGCSTVAETGRSQFIMPTITSADEAKMGLESFDGIKKQEKISTNAAANAQVKRVGVRIKDSVMKTHPMPDAQWEFVVFDSDQVNAFALPGGKVGVYTGLLKIVSSDDELAIVMGHEIAHVTSRHGAERMSQGQIASYIGQAGGAALGNFTQLSSTTQSLIMSAYGMGAQGTILKYSRDQESEADTIGMQFAATAGYNPQAAVTFWKKMASLSGKSASTGISGTIEKLTSTHPADADRIANLETLVPKYMPVYEQAKTQYK